MSFARNFAAGQQIAQAAMNAFDNARLGAILSEAEDAKPETLDRFSDEDAQRIHDAAASGNEVVWDEQSGGYAIKPATPQAVPNAAPQEGSEQGVAVTPRPLTAGAPEPLPDSAAPQPVAAAQPVAAPKPAPQSTILKPQAHTTYLDKTTVGTLTPEQLGAQKADRIKGRISELFDPNMGLKRLREMQTDEREDFKFGLLKTKAAQEAEAEARKKKSDEEALKAFNNSDTGKAYQAYNSDLAKWMQEAQEREQAIAAGTPESELPPARPKPSMPDISPIASIRDGMNVLLARMGAGGDVDFADVSKYSAAMNKLQDEGAIRALNAAKAGATTDRLVQMFNSTGQFRIDPNAIVDDQMVRGEDGTSNRIIKYRDPQTGKVATIDANAELNALGQAEQSLDKLYKMAQINYLNSGIQQREAATKKTLAEVAGTLPGKAPKTAFDKVVDYFDKFNPQDQPAQRAEGLNIARQAMALNPGADPEAIAYAAQVAAVEGDKSKQITRKLDFNTGQVVAVFTDPRNGKKIKLHQAKPTEEMAPVLKGEVQAYLAEQEELGRKSGSDMSWAETMKNAAANPQDKNLLNMVVENTVAAAYQTAQPKIMQLYKQQAERLRAMGEKAPPPPTREQILEKLRNEHRSERGMAAIQNRLNLIRAYGMK